MEKYVYISDINYTHNKIVKKNRVLESARSEFGDCLSSFTDSMSGEFSGE